MACGSCGKTSQRANRGPSVQEAPPQDGDYVVTYPNGETEVFRKVAGRPSPRRAAAYAALASGGTYEVVSEEPPVAVAPRASRRRNSGKKKSED